MKPRPSVLAAALLGLVFAGCSSPPPAASRPRSADVCAAVKKNTLPFRSYEALQRHAARRAGKEMWIEEIVQADLSVLTEERRISSDPRIPMLTEAWHYCVVSTSARNDLPELESELLAPVVDCETLDSLDAMTLEPVPAVRRAELLLELSVSSGFSRSELLSLDVSDLPDVAAPDGEPADPSSESVARALRAAQRLPEVLARSAGEGVNAAVCADAVAVHCSNLLRDVLAADCRAAAKRHAATGDRTALLKMRSFARRLATIPRREPPEPSDADRRFLENLGVLKKQP